MRNVTYTLSPDVAGTFLKKTAPLDTFARDIRWVFLYKRIPPLKILNQALLHGASPREAEWAPFEIDSSEYAELVEALCRIESERFQMTAPPDSIQTFFDWSAWVQSQA
jgi:hypothetical protein